MNTARSRAIVYSRIDGYGTFGRDIDETTDLGSATDFYWRAFINLYAGTLRLSDCVANLGGINSHILI
jgi:hypothetical protein